MTVDFGFGREIAGDLASAERREWLCTNGLGGYASGTVVGSLTRRYHGLLSPRSPRPSAARWSSRSSRRRWSTTATCGRSPPTRWASGSIEPSGHQLIERFHLDGTTPVWTYACADARIGKRVWMEPGANTTYVRYRLLRAGGAVRLMLRALVNHRDHYAVTRGDDWRMQTAAVADGIRIEAFDTAAPILLQASGVQPIQCEPAHTWYERFALERERERGLDWIDDHLHAATFTATLRPGETLTVVASTERDPSFDTDAAWSRRQAWEAERLAAWRTARAWARAAMDRAARARGRPVRRPAHAAR